MPYIFPPSHLIRCTDGKNIFIVYPKSQRGPKIGGSGQGITGRQRLYINPPFQSPQQGPGPLRIRPELGYVRRTIAAARLAHLVLESFELGLSRLYLLLYGLSGIGTA